MVDVSTQKNDGKTKEAGFWGGGRRGTLLPFSKREGLTTRDRYRKDRMMTDEGR